MPEFAQVIAATLPPSHIFEMARDRLDGESISLSEVLVPLALNVVYLAVSVTFFKYMYATSRRSGQFAKLGV